MAPAQQMDISGMSSFLLPVRNAASKKQNQITRYPLDIPWHGPLIVQICNRSMKFAAADHDAPSFLLSHHNR
jgi:hypothetical protein